MLTCLTSKVSPSLERPRQFPLSSWAWIFPSCFLWINSIPAGGTWALVHPRASQSQSQHQLGVDLRWPWQGWAPRTRIFPLGLASAFCIILLYTNVKVLKRKISSPGKLITWLLIEAKLEAKGKRKVHLLLKLGSLSRNGGLMYWAVAVLIVSVIFSKFFYLLLIFNFTLCTASFLNCIIF